MKTLLRCSRQIFLAFVLIAALSRPAASETERIVSFDSRISVNEDATLLVAETIKVISQGQQIKRGIYRDFPTRYTDRHGNNVIVGFQVKSVARDGNNEPYHIENMANGKRVYIGKSDVFIPYGVHTYEIVYRTTRQLGFFKEHDELYWNVTGNGWNFPISHVTASVDLPADAARQVLETNAFMGYYGERKKDFEIGKDLYGNPLFNTTATLNPTEGFTILVAWPKGYVVPPSSFDRLRYFLEDNLGVIVAAAAFLAVLFYYLFVWHMVGRDPKKGTIIPLFYPPQDLSPAAVRYLWKMGYDQKVFSVAVINLAVKGYLKIEETVPLGSINFMGLGKTYSLQSCATQVKEQATEEEMKVFTSLLGSVGSTLVLSNENHSKISSAIEGLKSKLSQKEEKVYFLTNKGYFSFGLFFSLAAGYLVTQFISMSPLCSVLGVIALVLIVLANFVFYRLLKAPTLQGRKVMDQMEGFRQFLSVTEKDRLNMLNPPEKTPELFEKYLPYALALDVEQKWSEQFSDVLAKAAEGDKEYRPGWYSGSDWSNRNPGRFSAGMAGAFTTTIAAAASPPGSSSGGGFSGGGGGGFSGGGGGGGGGGGW